MAYCMDSTDFVRFLLNALATYLLAAFQWILFKYLEKSKVF